MANRLFQGVINQMTDIIERTMGVLDTEFNIVACSDLTKTGEVFKTEFTREMIGNECTFIEDYAIKLIGSHDSGEYYVFVEGNDAIAEKYCALMAVSFTNIKYYYDEKYDRRNFVKNIILDNTLPGDIYLKAREMYFNSDASRCVVLVRATDNTDISIYDVIQNLFPDKNKDFVININETDVALVKEVREDISSKDIENLASSIADTLSGEFYCHVVIGVGTIVENLWDLARSFKEAQAALEVGKVFDTDKTIVCYDNLGIARLIYQLPTTLCETFLREVFKRGSIESLDHETLFTIQRFFENNLNVSETSRKLFVHRNTLVYRLEKIKKITGLDLREFDDAIIFKIALMVNKYLKANPIKY